MICNVPVCDSDIDEPIVIVPGLITIGKEYAGTSEDDKPVGVPKYSIYYELDTGKKYYYDNGQWNEIPCCSGGGGGGESVTWLIDNVTATVAFDSGSEQYCAVFALPDTITADNLVSTFSGKYVVTIVDGTKVEAPSSVDSDYNDVQVQRWNNTYNYMSTFLFNSSNLSAFVEADEADVGKTVTLSLGIVEE